MGLGWSVDVHRKFDVARVIQVEILVQVAWLNEHRAVTRGQTAVASILGALVVIFVVLGTWDSSSSPLRMAARERCEHRRCAAEEAALARPSLLVRSFFWRCLMVVTKPEFGYGSASGNVDNVGGTTVRGGRAVQRRRGRRYYRCCSGVFSGNVVCGV